MPAVCLLDGFAERDFFFSQNKARREAPFPRELIAHSQRFALERAEASEPADLAAIVHAIGDEGAQLEATLRVRFSALDLGELLARALPAEPAQQQPQQSTPAPARVADGDVPDAGARTAERSVAVDATAKVRHALADLELSCLRKLSVSLARAHGATSADGARALARALPATLADLRLDGLPAELAERVGALVRSGQLLHVQLRHCQPRPLGDAEVVALADAASANGASVRTLDLEGNAVGADGARALAGALRASASLTTLSVKRNALGSAGARAIAAALQGQRTLLHLDLSCARRRGRGGARTRPSLAGHVHGCTFRPTRSPHAVCALTRAPRSPRVQGERVGRGGQGGCAQCRVRAARQVGARACEPLV